MTDSYRIGSSHAAARTAPRALVGRVFLGIQRQCSRRWLAESLNPRPRNQDPGSPSTSAHPHARHHPNVARILAEHHYDSSSARRPLYVPIIQTPVKVLHREGLALRMMRD